MWIETNLSDGVRSRVGNEGVVTLVIPNSGMRVGGNIEELHGFVFEATVLANLVERRFATAVVRTDKVTAVRMDLDVGSRVTDQALV